MTLRRARRVMREALKDESLRLGYRANISMCMYDNLPPGKRGGIANREIRDKVSEEILNVLFN